VWRCLSVSVVGHCGGAANGRLDPHSPAPVLVVVVRRFSTPPAPITADQDRLSSAMWPKAKSCDACSMGVGIKGTTRVKSPRNLATMMPRGWRHLLGGIIMVMCVLPTSNIGGNHGSIIGSRQRWRNCVVPSLKALPRLFRSPHCANW
jgi:hypothetical protein